MVTALGWSNWSPHSGPHCSSTGPCQVILLGPCSPVTPSKCGMCHPSRAASPSPTSWPKDLPRVSSTQLLWAWLVTLSSNHYS